ncbi:MAG: alcohol dehydrogenase (cytochrome c) [Gammaproteobacteria bacterium]|jgi:alcohol dehydrogenase (cytochrome c)
MIKLNISSLIISVVSLLVIGSSQAQPIDDKSVTDEMLLNPDPADWLLYSRTYDNNRFSPLDQVNRSNVNQLKMAWSRGMSPGTQEIIPLVYKGVMYVIHPAYEDDVVIVQALDATNGKLVWEYSREIADDISEYASITRNRVMSLYQDKLLYSTPDGYLVALGADNGELHWEVKEHDYKKGTKNTTGPMVAGGKVITGRNCEYGEDMRTECFIAAHDATTGDEVWRFTAPAGPDEPGGDTWGDMPAGSRTCSPWGLPAGYNPEHNLVYWMVGNSSPHTRIKRYNGDPFAIPLTSPVELYCNSTLAIDLDTGELAWYYQYLPGDDWDYDPAHEQIRFTSAINPDPDSVKWINPNIPRGQVREMLVGVAETGGLWVLDALNGEFIWATPFPFDVPEFYLDDIDVETGRTSISRDMILTEDKQVLEKICFSNTKSYWPMAYHPGRNALYIPYHDACDKRTGALLTGNGHYMQPLIRTSPDADDWVGIAKVDMETGKIDRIHTQRAPSNGAVLVTAGELVFWGDMDRRFRAFDADNGEILWETIVGGIVQNSTITYAVGGRQYIAILTGEGTGGTSSKSALVPEMDLVRGHNAIYVFALPE